MKLLIPILLLLATTCFAQNGETVYQYKAEPFPFDSGVSISDRQYQMFLRFNMYGKMEQKATVPQLRVITMTQTVKPKGTGKIWVWFTSGAGAVAIAWVTSSIRNKK